MERQDLQAALDEVLAGTVPSRPAAGPPPRRAARDGVVRVDDENERLPPIRRAMKPAATVAQALDESGAGALVPAWYLVREATLILLLGWVAILVAAFAIGTEDPAAPFMAAVLARGIWLMSRRLSSRRHG